MTGGCGKTLFVEIAGAQFVQVVIPASFRYNGDRPR